MQNKRERYKKGTLVTYFERYLLSIIIEYIKSLNSDTVKIDHIKGWFVGYTKINNIELFHNIIQDMEIKKYLAE